MGAHTDISGCRIFDAGELGRLHVLAHRMLDLGLHGRGYRTLGRALAGRSGRGSAWVHVQWHMMIFELTVGRFREARARFERHVLPAVREGDALTDGPAGLWRLALAAPTGSEPLPWEAVRREAAQRLDTTTDPWIALHHLLALAGARDVDGLGAFIEGRRTAEPELESLLPLARALHAFTVGHWARAVAAFDEGIARLPAMGGSHAQIGLFIELRRQALLRMRLAAPGLRRTTPPPAAAGPRSRPAPGGAAGPLPGRSPRLPHALAR